MNERSQHCGEHKYEWVERTQGDHGHLPALRRHRRGIARRDEPALPAIDAAHLGTGVVIQQFVYLCDEAAALLGVHPRLMLGGAAVSEDDLVDSATLGT